MRNFSDFYPSCCCSDSNYSHFSLFIGNDKNVYSFGNTSFNSHGHTEEIIIQPQQILGLNNIKMISCGGYHSLFIDYDGNIYSLGDNTEGKLGINKDEEILETTFIPQKISFSSSIKTVSCGYNFTLCLSEDNIVYSFGGNEYGQLGLGNYDFSKYPQQILDLYNVEFIKSCGHHVICKTYNNDYYSWGCNDCGQLGNKNLNSKENKPIQCLNWPDNIIDIKGGLYHTLLLTNNGVVYGFGDNIFGQLGLNNKNLENTSSPTIITDLPEIQRIECGNDHSMFLDIFNNLWLCGANSYGQLGLGDENKRFNVEKNTLLNSNIIDIASGGNHTFVKTIDNKIYAFGYNEHSQLTIESLNTKQLTPIQVLENKEDIWCSTIGKSKQKSARK